MSTTSAAKQHLIIDSNIFQHFATKELGEGILENLREAVQAGYMLSISDFTFFELIDGASPEKEEERINAIGKIKRFYVKKSILVAAAHLGCLLQEDGHTVKDIGDKIIGATAIITNSLIYTLNGRDYPRPFFNEVAIREIKYSNNGRLVTMVAYFLVPNFSHISTTYSSRMPSKK